MKKNILLKTLSSLCLPLGAICFSSTMFACNNYQKPSTIKSVDGTDWDGRVRGSFAEGDYEIDEEQETITYTCGIGIQAIDLVIPDYVMFNGKQLKVYLGEQCFLNCPDLIGYVELNSFIDGIPDYCFAQCARLNGILFNVRPRFIGRMAFFDCPLFQKIAFLNYPYLDDDWALSIESIGDYAFYKCMLSGDLIFSNKLQHLGIYCFDECFKMNSVNLAFCDEIKTIPTAAFAGCSNISVVYMPPNIEEIGELAFQDCRNLKHVILPKDNMSIKLDKFCFAKCFTLIDFSKHFTINGPLGADAFIFNEALLSTPWSSEFGENKIIGKNVFASCKISSIVFEPNAITDVEDYAFSSCSNLSVIDFSLYDPSTPPNWSGTSIFHDCREKGTVYVPYGGIISQEWENFLLDNGIPASWNIKQKEPTIRYINAPEVTTVQAEKQGESSLWNAEFDHFVFDQTINDDELHHEIDIEPDFLDPIEDLSIKFIFHAGGNSNENFQFNKNLWLIINENEYLPDSIQFKLNFYSNKNKKLIPSTDVIFTITFKNNINCQNM